jgi:hypothetical protein
MKAEREGEYHEGRKGRVKESEERKRERKRGGVGGGGVAVRTRKLTEGRVY